MAPIAPDYRSKLVKVCNQVVTLQRKSGTDSFGKVTYSGPVEIRARYVEKQQRIVNPQGVEVTSSAEVTVVNEVAIGDKINTRTVQGRETVVSKPGKTLGLRLYL